MSQIQDTVCWERRGTIIRPPSRSSADCSSVGFINLIPHSLWGLTTLLASLLPVSLDNRSTSRSGIPFKEKLFHLETEIRKALTLLAESSAEKQPLQPPVCRNESCYGISSSHLSAICSDNLCFFECIFMH